MGDKRSGSTATKTLKKRKFDTIDKSKEQNFISMLISNI